MLLSLKFYPSRINPVTQWVKPMPITSTPKFVLFYVLAALLLVQLPDEAPGKAVEDVPTPLTPATT